MATYRIDLVDHKYRTYFVEADSEELAYHRLFAGDKKAGEIVRSHPATMKQELLGIMQVTGVEHSYGIQRLRRQKRRSRRSLAEQLKRRLLTE